jgi:hypothetical protein
MNGEHRAAPRLGRDARQWRDRWLARAADSVESCLRSPLFLIWLSHGLHTLTGIQALLSLAPRPDRFQGHPAPRSHRFARNAGR